MIIIKNLDSDRFLIRVEFGVITTPTSTRNCGSIARLWSLFVCELVYCHLQW